MHLPPGAEDFVQVSGAYVWRSDLGYLVCSDDSRAGARYGRQRLPTPLTGKMTFRAKLNMSPSNGRARRRQNGFLMFGARPDKSPLMHCGILQRQKKATITEATGKDARVGVIQLHESRQRKSGRPTRRRWR